MLLNIGNAAQEGRYERETHARYRPFKKKPVNVRKPVNASPGLKVNRIITFSSIQMFFAALFCVSCDY